MVTEAICKGSLFIHSFGTLIILLNWMLSIWCEPCGVERMIEGENDQWWREKERECKGERKGGEREKTHQVKCFTVIFKHTMALLAWIFCSDFSFTNVHRIINCIFSSPSLFMEIHTAPTAFFSLIDIYVLVQVHSVEYSTRDIALTHTHKMDFEYIFPKVSQLNGS